LIPLLCIFSLIPPPLSSTLFPYTTLFRSPKLRLVHASGAGYDTIAMDALSGAVVVCNVFHHERAIAEYAIMTMLALDRDLFRQEDRKSTRLNSSHLGISYAVFCLKKKNTK